MKAAPRKIFICNLMTQPGETDNYSARQHLETIKRYAPEIQFDYVVVNDRPITAEQAERYAQEGAQQIGIEDDSLEACLDQSTQIIRANLLEEGEKVRHDSHAALWRSNVLPATSFVTLRASLTRCIKTALPQSQPQSLDVLILAAGLGTRMKSARAKVLHEIGGFPLIVYVCRTAKTLDPEKI